jgi:hypothetical protein
MALMSLLDELLTLPPSTRGRRLGHADTRAALVALGKEGGVAWLEKHIESPIVREWGRLLYALTPEWKHLERWIRLSKVHCLAAMDALLLCIPSTYTNEDRPAQLPQGADPAAINASVDYALEHYDNPRLQDAAKQIRHAWPVGAPSRHTVRFPRRLKEFAEALFANDSALISKWSRSLADALDPPKSADDYWQSLLEVGDRADIVAIVDWRESPDEIIERLRSLRSAKDSPIPWDRYANFDGENVALFCELNRELKGSGRSLVSLDTGGDSYALVFFKSETISALESLIASALKKQSSTIRRFE